MGSAAPERRIDRSVFLDLVGDWGQATFHKILSWVTQEFCDRAGPQSRTKIWSIRGGGSEAVPIVHSGEADLCVVTPAKLMTSALKGEGIFEQYGAMPHLKALAVLPQRDRMMLAVHPDTGVQSFADMREKTPALKIAQSKDDGSSFIGYVSTQILAAHGITDTALQSWGGEKVPGTRPHDCLDAALNGEANAVIQEAIMLHHWNELIEKRGWIPIPFEAPVLEELASRPGFGGAKVERNFWTTVPEEVQALDFADFVILVRDDMPDEVAELLTWCLVHTRKTFEKQFHHIPPDKCSLTYPMEPSEMAKTPIELHPGAKRVYVDLGIFPS